MSPMNHASHPRNNVMIRSTLVSVFFTLCQICGAQYLAWANNVGAYAMSGGNIFAADLAVDELGSVISAGTFYDAYDLDPGTGVAVLTSPTFTASAYVQKLDPTGNFLWARSFGAAFQFMSVSNVIAIGTTDILVTGTFEGTVDFDPGPGVDSRTATSRDLFMLKLNAAGEFLWVRTVGGTDWMYVSALSPVNNGFLVGGAYSGTVDFDPGTGANEQDAVNADGYILRLDLDGEFVWVKTLPSIGNAQVFALRTRAGFGDIIVGGHFGGNTDFNPGAGFFQLSSLNQQPPYYPVDCFVLRLTNAGEFLWAKSYGGENEDYVTDVVLTSQGEVVVNGTYNSTADFDPGTDTTNLTALFTDAYFLKLTAAGSFVWVRTIAGGAFITVSKLAITQDDNMYCTGSFEGTADFDMGPGVNNATATGSDIYVLGLDQSGSTLDIDILEGSAYEQGVTMVTDANANLYSTGYFEDPMDFDPQPTVYTNVPQNNYKWVYTFKWRQCENVTTNIINATGCTYTSGDQVYSGNGTYTEIGQNVAGCDSVTVINLTESSTNTYVDTLSCTGSFTFNGETYTASGSYVQAYTNAAGCDSSFYLTVAVGSSSSSSITASACDFYQSGQAYYQASGVYTEYYINTTGCDSVVTLDLTIEPSASDYLEFTDCDTVVFAGNTYTSSGLISLYYTAANGCDSIVTLNINIIATDTSVVLSGSELTSQAFGQVDLQWVTCPGYDPIPGATQTTFTPEESGSYAVIMVEAGCADTSGCHTVIITGLADQAFAAGAIKVFPNPAEDKLNIQLPDELSGISEVRLYDAIGQLVTNRAIGPGGSHNATIDVRELRPGLYLGHILGAMDGRFTFIKR
jgi:hypothetical protein